MGKTGHLRAGMLGLLGMLLAACVRTPEPEDPLRFQLLDTAGQPAADGAAHHCVFDRRSTLTWAVPRAEDALLDPGHRFTWYSSQRDVHLGDPGTQSGGHCGIERCDIEALVEAINARGLCGHHDWRLPSHEESIMLGKHHSGHPIGMHPRLFPAAQTGELWTLSTFRMHAPSAWAMDPVTGLDRVDLKTVAKPVRLVRGKLELRRRGG